MEADLAVIGEKKVKSLPNAESMAMKTLWQDKNTVVVFFRRWGCMLCRLWAKELGEIAPVLKKHDIKLVGIGVEEAGSKEFIDGKYFDGDLYYVEDISTYQTLGFKRFNVVSIITSLFWKQSRDAIFKGRGMGIEYDASGDGLQNGGALVVRGGKLLKHFVQIGPGLGGNLKGDWVQTGGALLVDKSGKLIRHFVQTGPGDHLHNREILKLFGLENEYNPQTMPNDVSDAKEATTEGN